MSIGPKTTVKRSCADCEVCQGERYTCQSDSGRDVYCAHPSLPQRRIIGDTRWDTPQWCPAEPEIAARADARIAELERERNSLRDFANDVMESWPHGDVDGCDLERMAVEHGLLALKDPKPTEPCCDNCACSGYPSPEEWADGIDCYVRTPLLTGSIDAARAGKP